MLFRTSEELKKYLPQNAAFEFEQIEPFIRLQAEPDIILPVLGDTQFASLDTAYNNNNLSAVQEKLLDKVRYPLAYYAYCKYIPVSQVKISASGIHIESSDSIKTAFNWQIEDLEQSFLAAAYKGVELLYSFLEANKADYTEWTTNNPAYSILHECFINSATQFSGHYNIGNSRRLFLAMKTVMKQEEKKRIRPITGTELFNELKTQIAAGNVTDLNKTLLEFIEPAVANFTMGRGLVQLDVSITPEGLQLNTNPGRQTVKERMTATPDIITAIINDVTKEAANYTKQLNDYLYDNATAYPLFKNSSVYVDPSSDDAKPWDQTGNGIVSF